MFTTFKTSVYKHFERVYKIGQVQVSLKVSHASWKLQHYRRTVRTRTT